MGVTRNPVSYNNAKGLPPVTNGKTFFVSDTTGADWEELKLNYPNYEDGIPALYTSVTDALAQCTTDRGDVICLATDFVTALTAAEILSAETKGVAVIPMGKNNNGLYFTERATDTLPQSVREAIFTTLGKVKILNLVGTVTTAIQAQDCNALLFHSSNLAGLSLSGTLTTQTIAGAVNINAAKTGSLLTLRGTPLTAGLQLSQAGVVSEPKVALIVQKGKIYLDCSASNAGSIKWRVDWIPLEPGARVVAA